MKYIILFKGKERCFFSGFFTICFVDTTLNDGMCGWRPEFARHQRKVQKFDNKELALKGIEDMPLDIAPMCEVHEYPYEHKFKHVGLFTVSFWKHTIDDGISVIDPMFSCAGCFQDGMGYVDPKQIRVPEGWHLCRDAKVRCKVCNEKYESDYYRDKEKKGWAEDAKKRSVTFLNSLRNQRGG